MIFLDNASTTQVFPEVAELTVKYYTDEFFNPSATYRPSIKIKRDLDDARQSIAKILHVNSKEIFFTSGATEASNWVINSALKNKSGNIVVSEGEHACIYESAKALLSKGVDVRFVKLKPDGQVDENDFRAKVDKNTGLVSVIHVSNETGVVNNLKNLVNIAKKANPRLIFHSDGVQAFGKIETNLSALNIDLYSISGHKFGAPKGVGVLYIKKGINLSPIILGGGQESGSRSGTENVAGIVAMGKAAQLYLKTLDKQTVENNYSLCLELIKNIEKSHVIGNTQTNSKLIIAVAFEGCKAEIIQSMLADKGIYVGRGSACSSRHAGNRVLSAMSIPQQLVDGTIRISLSTKTTENEIKIAMRELKTCVEKLRGNKIG